jgi:hypothetical protein
LLYFDSLRYSYLVKLITYEKNSRSDYGLDSNFYIALEPNQLGKG